MRYIHSPVWNLTDSHTHTHTHKKEVEEEELGRAMKIVARFTKDEAGTMQIPSCGLTVCGYILFV